ncbi:hypothetical protein D3C78_1599450 [compost metagenome]
MANEIGGRRFDVDALQGHVVAHAFLLQGHEAFDGKGACPDFAHCIQVQLEVAVMTLGRTIIRLLTQYDLVNQPRGLGILRR